MRRSTVPRGRGDCSASLVGVRGTGCRRGRFGPGSGAYFVTFQLLSERATVDVGSIATPAADGVTRRCGLFVPTASVIRNGPRHNFYAEPELPESREAYARVARFFTAGLGEAR